MFIIFFQEFVGYREGAMGSSDIIPSTVAKQERISGDLAMEIGKDLVFIILKS